MSFSQEMKDFVSGYKTVAASSAGRAATTKKGDATFDPNYKADPEYDPATDPEHNPAKSDGHGWLYHLGQWFHPTHAPYSPSSYGTSNTGNGSAIDDGTGGDGGDNQYYAQNGEPTQAYSRGGYVKAYAEGGAVDDSDLAPVTVTPQNSAVPAAPPPPAAAAPAPMPAAPADSAVPMGDNSAPGPGTPPPPAAGPKPDGSSLGDALHGGVTWLQQHLGLDQSNNAVPDEQQAAAGKQALMSGAGAASTDDIKAMAAAVDPGKQLTHSQVMIRGMERGYEFYMEQGDPDKANKYAAMIIQYSTHEAAKYGDDAIQALKQGDLHGAAHSLAAGYANLPDGKSAEDVKVNPNGTVSVTETDATTGKPIAQHTLTGQQLYQAALGLSNKSMAYGSLMDAAAATKGVNLPQSQAYTDAVAKLGGADGTGGAAVTPVGNASPAPAAPAGGIDPAYQKMMASGESSNSPTASNGSSVGLYGLQPAAWAQATNNAPMVVNGVDQRTVPGPASAAFQKYTQQNAAQFQKTFNRAPSPAELSVMHQQGAGGGIGLLHAAQTAPNTPAVQILSQFMPQAKAVQSLTGNRIPANATAQQAVQAIQGYYAKGAQGAAPAQPQGPMALQPALPEDQPAAPQLPDKPIVPTPPSIIQIDSNNTAGMSPQERVAYKKTVDTLNANKKTAFSEQQGKFNDNMKIYTQAVAAAKTKASGPSLSLPVKDRGDALTALATAKSDYMSDPNNALKGLQPGSQKAADDVAYGLYTHNDTTPARAYQATAQLLSMDAKPDPKKPGSMIINQTFTPHEIPGTDGVKIVFRTGDTMVIPKNTFAQIAAARGNELFVQRQAAIAAAKAAAASGKSSASGWAALKAAGNIAGNAASAVGGAAIKAPIVIGNAVLHPVTTAGNIGMGTLRAIDSASQNRQ